jgi:hypothetical protein
VEAPPKKELEEIEHEEEKPPEVTGVEPAGGPIAGGTTVTVRGHYLLKATQVQFGGAKFRVAVVPGTASEQSVTVASPAHPAGTVDALVKLSNGTLSETRPEDRFTFFTPEAHGESPPPPGGSGGGGEVLSFGPSPGPPASCRVSLLSRSVTVSSKGRAPLKLLLAGVGACRGKLTLSVKLTRPHARPNVRTIGTVGFAAATGKVVAVVVTLSKFARGLLHASHGHLAASLMILRLSPGPAQAHTASVRLALKSSHPSAKHH